MKKLFVLLLSVVVLSGCGESEDDARQRRKREMDLVMRNFDEAFKPLRNSRD